MANVIPLTSTGGTVTGCLMPNGDILSPPCERFKVPNMVGIGPSKPDANIFNYIVKAAKKGQVQYFGAIVEGDQEHLTPIPASMYMSLTGQPNTYSTDGLWRFYRPMKTGADLARYNRTIGATNGYKKAAVDAMIKLIPFRTMALAALELDDVAIANQNDLFEIFTKYIAHHPEFSKQLHDGDYHALIAAHVDGRDGNHFDVSGMMNTIADLVGTGVNIANNVELTGYVNNFLNYMTIDFAEIKRVYNELGPEAAIDKYNQYKNGSWKELHDFIFQWCNDHHMEVPDQIKAAIDEQIKLKDALTRELSNNRPGGGSSSGGSSSGGSSSGGSSRAPFDPNAKPTPTPAFDMNMLMIAAAALIFIVLLVK